MDDKCRLKELYEFLQMLDFDYDEEADELVVIDNRLDWDSIPETAKEYLKGYFQYLDSIN